MAYPQVIIPPSVKPESPYEPQLIDEQTTEFRPRFGRGTTQRQIWADPSWGWKLRYRALAGADRALVRAAILEARGKGSNILVTPGQPLRGSFPATELLTNNDFSNGTTGWASQYSTLSVTDRILRVTATGATMPYNFAVCHPSVSVTQYAPVVLRSVISATRDPLASNGIYDAQDGSNYSVNGSGYFTKACVPRNTTIGSQYPGVWDGGAGTSHVAGDYGEVYWCSQSRCALVDNGPNALLYSDQIDNAAWTKTLCSTSADVTAAPDGTTTADAFVEDGTSGAHRIHQSVTVSSSAADFTFSVCVKGATRGYIEILLNQGSGNAYQYFNLSTGTLAATSAAGTGWSNLRATATALGNGWYRYSVTVRKTDSSTTVSAYLFSASADGTDSYLGNSSTAFYVWRASLATSAAPTRGAQTTSAATTGTSQTGGTLYVKGLPASTSGLLLAGDWFEINGELKQCTASLDSDAAGLGVLKFRPGLWSSPADNDPVIILNPFGRFSLASNPRITEHFGIYSDIELDLIEAGP